MIRSSYHIDINVIAEEQAVIEAAKADPAKFSLLYERYYGQIIKFIKARLEDRNEAEDVVHQVFLKAMLNLKKYTHQGVPFVSWLYRIALSEVNDYYRKSKKQRAVHAESEQIYNLLEEMDEVEVSDQFNSLISLLERLPSEDLEFVEMRFFEKMAFKDIADIKGITENHAKVKLYRILDKMKKLVSKR